MAKQLGNLMFENARILFRNFSGKPSQFNREGDRNFCVVIDDPAHAQALADEGWNVRVLAPRDEDEEPRHYIPVAVSFENIPPKLYTISKKVKTALTEDMVGELDIADIRSVDLIIRPYHWEVNGKTGIKGYLASLYATLEEDGFANKYSEGAVIESPFSSYLEAEFMSQKTMKKIETIVIFDAELDVYGTVENPYFRAVDVAHILEYSRGKAGQMISQVPDEEKGRYTVSTQGGPQETWMLSEDGLYEVLFYSRKPIAVSFRREVRSLLRKIRLENKDRVLGIEMATDDDLPF